MTQPVRFVHAADVHLDAPFSGVDASDARMRAELIDSTYRALDAVVEACLAHEADFLVIAGDVYNHADKSLRAQFAFRDACERLDAAGIRVFVARGNHDPASGWSAGLTMPANVHVFSERETERVVFVRDGEPACALYGRSFRVAAERDNLARTFARDPADVVAVGVVHANVGGRTEYDDYAPCTLEDLRSARMDYWALGHIHKPETLSEEPAIVYAGCTQGLDPSEPGIRGCRVVTIADGCVEHEFVPTAAVVWESITVDASELESADELVEALTAGCEAARGRTEGRPAIVRVELVGRSGAHALLARPGVARDLVERVRAEALDAEPWVWLDRAADHTRPSMEVAALREGDDLAGDVVRLADEILARGAAASFIAEVAEPLSAALDAGDLPEPQPDVVLERARDLVLDRLLEGEGR